MEKAKSKKKVPKKRQSYSRRPEIIQLLAEGVAVKEIAEKLEVGVPYVRQFAKPGQNVRDRVVEMIAQGMSNKEIAAAAECSIQYVYSVRKQPVKTESKRSVVVGLLKEYAAKGQRPVAKAVAEMVGASESTVRSAMCEVYGQSGRDTGATARQMEKLEDVIRRCGDVLYETELSKMVAGMSRYEAHICLDAFIGLDRALRKWKSQSAKVHAHRVAKLVKISLPRCWR